MGDFWQNQTTWPRDTQEMVFLGRAVNLLGRALFGEEWTGDEPVMTSFPLFQILVDSRATNNLIARHLSQFGRREYHGSMAPPPTGHDDYRPKFEFSKEELQEMKLFIDRYNEAVPQAKERFKKVLNAVADYALTKKLGTSFRAMAGGDFHSIQPNWWNTERLEQRFSSCRINPDDPFGPSGAAWIFVARADLEDCLLKASASPSQAPQRRRGAPRRYDWEDAKLFVCKELGIHGDFDLPKNQTAGWRSQNDLIDRLLKYMGRDGEEPGRSTAQGYVSKWVAEWRSGTQ